jgi:DNA-binding response OmpR family regulator
MKILVAEDDKFLANAYRVKLSKAGFEVKLTSDGDETLKALDAYAPDVIVLDLVMPKKDGFTVLSALKSSEKWKNVPCIVASNLGQKEDIDKAKNLGADDYIIKTDLSMGKLVDKIKALAPK